MSRCRFTWIRSERRVSVTSCSFFLPTRRPLPAGSAAAQVAEAAADHAHPSIAHMDACVAGGQLLAERIGVTANLTKCSIYEEG